MQPPSYVLGVDVGTGSARTGLFDAQGHRLAVHSHPIEIWRPAVDFAELSSADIWRAIGIGIRECLKQAGIRAEQVSGISFAATGSMVVADTNGLPLPVNFEGRSERDIIAWQDRRATAETDKINAGGYSVLRYAGGKLSPETQTPRLVWLKRNLPDTWRRAGQFFDLADWLTWKSTGNLSRSQCTTVCKWTYLAQENRWDENFFRSIGIGDAMRRIGDDIRPMGTPLGRLSVGAAADLGLTPDCTVGQGIMDAHAGGLGLLGAIWEEEEGTPLEKLETSLTLIGDTDNFHMAVSREAIFLSGVSGPYYGAMVPGMWLSEGAPSTVGGAIDQAIADFPNSQQLFEEAKAQDRPAYELLNETIARLGGAPTLTKNFHVLPYYQGTRSPSPDPQARAIYDGVSSDISRESHAIRYYATLQSVAYGTREIIESMNRNGYSIDTVFVTGDGTKNPLWLQEHADVTGATLILPEERETVLLGSAVLAATAAGLHTNIYAAMKAMSRAGEKIVPRPKWQAYHDAKYEIFRDMYAESVKRREKMQGF